MFKLNAARVSEPGWQPLLPSTAAASWMSEEGKAAEFLPHHAASGGDDVTSAHHAVWEGVWGWLHGQQAATAAAFATQQRVDVLAATLAGSTSELASVEAGCSLGLLSVSADRSVAERHTWSVVRERRARRAEARIVNRQKEIF